MSPSTTKIAFWRGVRVSLPFLIVVVPFATLFGVAATEAGLPLAQVMGFTSLVIAGASQFTALQFMMENAPVLVVIASALAVNLRMAMYSAALTPMLGDQALWKRAFISYIIFDQTYNLMALDSENKCLISVGESILVRVRQVLHIASQGNQVTVTYQQYHKLHDFKVKLSN